jgi:hypothetical protein
MFENLFAKFKKYDIQPIKNMEELEAEFSLFKAKYAQIANSELYQFLKEYFKARLEINRDILEGLNPHSEENRSRLLQAQSENKVIRDFITDIEEMKNKYES